MKNLLLICMLFFSTNIFCQNTVILKNENYNQKIVGVSKIGDKILINNLPLFSCCFGDEKCNFRNLLFEQIVIFMKSNPTFVFEISSHTDSQGNDKYNLKLSNRIVSNLEDFFVEKEINKKRIKTKGMGETQILNECKNRIKCPDEKHQENRRIEIKIIDIQES